VPAGDLDVDGQARRAALIRLQAMAEAAVVVAVASQRIDDPGGRAAFEAGGGQPAFQEPALAQDEGPSSGEFVVHARDVRRRLARLS